MQLAHRLILVKNSHISVRNAAITVYHAKALHYVKFAKPHMHFIRTYASKHAQFDQLTKI